MFSTKSYQEYANNLELYLQKKLLFKKFKKNEICRIFDYRYVTIDIAVAFLEQSKGKLRPAELLEVLQHWKINFGWDANKAAKISLLISENLKAPFFNDYIRYFLKKIVDSYQDTIKESKRVRKENRQSKSLNHELQQKNEYFNAQIQIYEEIKRSQYTNMIAQAQKIEIAQFRMDNFKKIIERKDREIEGLKEALNRQDHEIKKLKIMLAPNNHMSTPRKGGIKSSKTNVGFAFQKFQQTSYTPTKQNLERPVMGSPTMVYIPRCNSGTGFTLKRPSNL